MSVRLVSALVMIIVLDHWFAVVFVPGAFLVIGITYMFRKVLKRLHKSIQESDGRLRIFLQEHISSLMVVKAYAVEAQTIRDATGKMAEHKNARMKRIRFSNIANSGFAAAMQGMYLVGVVYCGYGIITGSVTYGTLTAVMQLVGQVQGPFANISGYLPRWYAMAASCERLMEIEEAPDDETAQDQEKVNAFYADEFEALGLRHADFTYEAADGTETVLKDLNLELKKGEFLALRGRSGIGKSTALKLLMGMYPLDAGERFVNDQVLDASWRRLFAYVPQGNALMAGTIREVVSFADPEAAQDDERIWQALRLSCAEEFVTDPDLALGERGSGLSEGQMQRLAVARAIFSNRPILLLDEATSALDEATEAALLQNIKELTDKTVVIVTHRKAALSVCDRTFDFG